MRCQDFARVFVCLCMGTALTCVVPSALSAQEVTQEVPHESGLYYTIQKGDTLWDLSRRFFDSPELWPELWQKNHQIPNPHWIYPGEQIRLHHQEGIERLQESEKIIEQAKAEEVKTGPPQGPALKEPPFYYYASIESVGFIRREAVKPSGTIFRSQDDKAMISERDIVYVRSADEHTILQPGAIYTVYRTFAGVTGRKFGESAQDHGVQHYFTGALEIVKQDADYYVARVIRSYRDIRLNDLLMPHRSRSPKIVLAESVQGISGQILFNEDRDRMFADNTIAFIDKGKRDGIEVGQLYSVFYEDVHGLKFYKEGELRRSKREKAALKTPIDFAEILVLLTEESTSTVLVTYSARNLYPTARVRTPERQP